METGIQRNANMPEIKEGPLSKLLNLFMLKPKADAEAEFTLQGRDENVALMEDIMNARSEWQTAVHEMDNVNDKDIVDYCIYKIKACQIRYEYLIRQAREKGISIT